MKSAVLTTLAATAAALALSACGDDERTATAETSVAEAEVSTEMPEAAVPTAQLEASANRAAANVRSSAAATASTTAALAAHCPPSCRSTWGGGWRKRSRRRG